MTTPPWLDVIEKGELSKQEVNDIKLIKLLLEELRDGYSIALACKRAGISEAAYESIKRRYPSLKDDLKPYFQNATKWKKYGY